MKSYFVKLVVHMSWTRYLFRGDIYERFWYINRKIELVKEKVLGFINANSEMFWSHCGIIQDEINWIPFFLLMASGIFKISLKIRLIFIVWNTEKLAKHLLTGTFLGDSIYFRINLSLAFYRIKRGKKWQNIQWHPLKSAVHVLLSRFFRNSLYPDFIQILS